MKKHFFFRILGFLILSICIFWLSNFVVREEHTLLYSLYFSCFIGGFLVYKSYVQKFDIKIVFAFAIFLRLMGIMSFPGLSNDFFRFLWDGELMNMGVNPYNHTPNELISHAEFMGSDYFRVLYHGMGELSASNYSCYPIVNQIYFYIGTFFSDNVWVNVIVLRSIMILTEIIGLYYAWKLMQRWNVKPINFLFIAINPFLILEFSVNLHFEMVMISFVIMSLYFLSCQKNVKAGLFMAIAILIKLIPLVLLPFVLKKIGLKRFLSFMFVCLNVVVISSLLLMNSSNFDHFFQSIALYFNQFEFNASIYFLFREIGIVVLGYNPIQYVGPALSILVVFILGVLWFKQKNENADSFLKVVVFSLFIYLLFSTTVHPWYIAFLLVISAFTNYKFPIVWSLVAIFSYSAYTINGFEPNYYLIGLEYFILYASIIAEAYLNRKKRTKLIEA